MVSFPNKTLPVLFDQDISSSGLPTHVPGVARFMTGLEKTKAKAEEVSMSACAIGLVDMEHLHDLLITPPDINPKSMSSLASPNV
jgi:hypothetical protein